MVKHTLIFNFYVDNNFEENIANKMHFHCLKRYANIFDTSKFFITLDDINNIELIEKLETILINIGYNKNVTFIIKQNNEYREADTFYHEVVEKLNDYDGLIFFAHNKGITNVANPNFKQESILNWICGMYFLNLEDIVNVDKQLINNFISTFYGAFLTIGDTIENRLHRWYAGTFFWVNTRRFLNNIKQEGIELIKLHDRGYAEMFPGEMCTKEGQLCSYGSMMLYAWDAYTCDITELIKFLLITQENYNSYNEFYINFKNKS